MNLLRTLVFAFVLLTFASTAFAWSYVPNTYQSNQVAGPVLYKPSTPYQGWNYYSYYPTSGYPVLGGGTYHPPGYLSGSYAVNNYYPIYNAYPSYGYGYNAPVHTTVDFYYKSGNFSFGCTIYSC